VPLRDHDFASVVENGGEWSRIAERGVERWTVIAETFCVIAETICVLLFSDGFDVETHVA
jgi:hypothetical protein